jgi:zinc transport system ATP-binding protein
MNALEVKNLVVRFGEQEIIRNISFALPEGTITALIGPNGAGKSVLLKTILGLYPYEGEIKIFGENHLKMLHLVGYVPQNYNLDPILPLTVYEFLKISNPQGDIDEVLKEIDIENIKDKNISRLSGGQLQRVLFARAILAPSQKFYF